MDANKDEEGTIPIRDDYAPSAGTRRYELRARMRTKSTIPIRDDYVLSAGTRRYELRVAADGREQG
ncbi:MAG: hypothetical protein HUU26_09620 [Gemmatimonadaceae bacterium]|nr:hypothetical protein [Gemmatimonadaceae bacterium]